MVGTGKRGLKNLKNRNVRWTLIVKDPIAWVNKIVAFEKEQRRSLGQASDSHDNVLTRAERHAGQNIEPKAAYYARGRIKPFRVLQNLLVHQRNAFPPCRMGAPHELVRILSRDFFVYKIRVATFGACDSLARKLNRKQLAMRGTD